MRREVVVLPPELPFREVHAAFMAAGWEGGPVTRLAPLVQGEPEVARYRRGSAVALVSADPVVWLRTVEGSTAELPPLPRVAAATVLAWLADDGAGPDAREARLRGVLAAGVLRLRRAERALRRLAGADDRFVATAAARVLADAFGDEVSVDASRDPCL